MNFLTRLIALLGVMAAVSLPAFSQGAEIAFAGLKHDTKLPVEVSADQLSVSQSDGTAVFSGNVVVGQGSLRLTAGQVLVKYSTTVSGRIEEMLASGGVMFVNGTEAAEAKDAAYNIDDGMLVLTGGVLLTQGASALSGEKLIVNLNAGTGVMQGRVKTVLQPATK